MIAEHIGKALKTKKIRNYCCAKVSKTIDVLYKCM